VHGLLFKDSDASVLISCLRNVAAGYRSVPSELVRQQVRRLADADSLGHLLTWREREVLCLVAKGLPNKIVAEQLGISAGTVKLHLHHIYCKIGVSSRSALRTLALRLAHTPAKYKALVANLHSSPQHMESGVMSPHQ
jgi:DNA-binding NarL/FixJ family response regulator